MEGSPVHGPSVVERLPMAGACSRHGGVWGVGKSNNTTKRGGLKCAGETGREHNSALEQAKETAESVGVQMRVCECACGLPCQRVG